MSMTARATQRWVDDTPFDDHGWFGEEMRPTNTDDRDFSRPAAPRQPPVELDAHRNLPRQPRYQIYAEDEVDLPERPREVQDQAGRASSASSWGAHDHENPASSSGPAWSPFPAASGEFELRRIAEAAERGAILGSRRLDKVRAEWRDFTRRFETASLTATELRQLRADLRRREALLFLLGGFVLVMSVLYGALLFSSPQLLGNPRSELGCVMFGGTWAETASSKEYCIFWAH